MTLFDQPDLRRRLDELASDIMAIAALSPRYSDVEPLVQDYMELREALESPKPPATPQIPPE